MYYGVVDGSNLCVRGNTSTTINNTSALGAYSGKWVQCGDWPQPNNFSVCRWSNELDSPKVNTGMQTSNLSFNQDYRYGGRVFHFGMKGSNAGGSKYGFSSPFASLGQGGGTVPAYTNNTLSSRQNFITTTATAVYGYSFLGYRLESSSGTFLTATASANWFFNSTYGGTNMAYIKYFFASFFNVISDRRLKENIRLVGKSASGINIYTWNYKDVLKHGKGLFEGVMAQEVPQASIQHPDGYLMVDYSKIDVTFKKVYGSNMGSRKCKTI